MKKNICFKVKGDIKEIREVFLDLNLYCKLHPLLLRAEKIELEKEQDIYRIYEKPFSWLPVKIKYKAQVIQKSNDVIEYLITDIPFTKAVFNYEFSQTTKQLVSINWTIEIINKLFWKNILMRKMIDAQEKIINAIAEK